MVMFGSFEVALSCPIVEKLGKTLRRNVYKGCDILSNPCMYWQLTRK